MIFNLKLRKKAASWAKATSTQSDQITLNFEASAKTNKTFAEAKSRKQLKSLQQSDAEVIYESATGKLYFNANGKDKGWGDKNKSGFFAKIRGKPSLSAFNLNGYTNLFQSELNAYAISMQSDKSLREFVKLLKKPSRAMSKFIKNSKKDNYESSVQEVKQAWLPFFENFQNLHDFASSEDYDEYKNNKRGYNAIGRAYFKLLTFTPTFGDYRFEEVYGANAQLPEAPESVLEVQEGDDSCTLATQGTDFILMGENVESTTGNISNFQTAEVCGLNGDDLIHGNGKNNNLFGGNHNHLNSGAYQTGTDNDVIISFGGDNGVYGGGGNDFLQSIFGKDIQKGGEGNDLILQWGGTNRQHGNQGNDTLMANSHQSILTGGDGLDVFLVAQSPLFHFGYQEITDFGSGGKDIVYFPATMEEMMLRHEADYEGNSISIYSNLTDRLVLKIDVLSSEVGLTNNAFWATTAEEGDNFFALRDQGNLDLSGFINANIQGFMM